MSAAWIPNTVLALFFFAVGDVQWGWINLAIAAIITLAMLPTRSADR